MNTLLDERVTVSYTHLKTGRGLGVDFNLKKGPVTLVNMTQSDPDVDTFKLIYTVGEVVDLSLIHIST